MTWQRYLTDAERRYRPSAMQTLYCHRLDFTIKGVTFTRWFKSEYERDDYRAQLPTSGLRYIIDKAE